MDRWSVALLAGATLAGCTSPAPREPAASVPVEGETMELVEITNGTVTVGVLPSLGGRVVLLEAGEGPNLLQSDRAHWTAPFPEPALETPFEQWNGRIVWVGPQSGFWSQQELVPERAGTPWPPDPFNETGRFAIAEQAPTRLRLQGETSPVTGLSLQHEYEITGERTVRLGVTATNERAAPVSWDLWPNTRVQPAGFPYVPLSPDEPPRMDGPDAGATGMDTYPHESADGWLEMPPGHLPAAPATRSWAKAYVRPPRGLIAFFHAGQLLLIRAPLVPVEELHPEQAFVEIYRGSFAGGEPGILELEMHGPHVTLAPGESMSFEQAFEVREYDGEDTPAAHRAFLGGLGF